MKMYKRSDEQTTEEEIGSFSNTLPIGLEGRNTKYVQCTVYVKRCFGRSMSTVGYPCVSNSSSIY